MWVHGGPRARTPSTARGPRARPVEPQPRDLATIPTHSLEAYDYYLRGNDYLRRGTCGECACSERRDHHRHHRDAGCAAAELSPTVVAPTVGRPAVGEPTGVSVAPGNGAKAQAPGNGDRNRSGRRGPVAQLATAVIAPTVCCPANGDRARVSACGDCCERQAPGDRDRCGFRG